MGPAMNRRKLKSILLEIQYGRKLRKSTKKERRTLVSEAYEAVRKLRSSQIEENVWRKVRKRRAGSSRRLVDALIMLCNHDSRVLEVGCGRGHTCSKLAPYVECIAGIDASESNVEEARGLLLEANITNFQVYKALADSLPECFAPQSFDKVMSIDVLEHLHPDDHLAHLSDAFELLRPGGCYIAIAPNRFTGPHDVTRIIYPDATEPMGFHLNEFSYGDIVRDMKNIGFHNIRSPLPIWPLTPTISNKLLIPSKWFIRIENTFLPVRHGSTLSLFYRKTLFRLLGVFVIGQKPFDQQ